MFVWNIDCHCSERYSKEACSLHRVLPRVLQHMSQKTSTSNSKAAEIEALMESVGLEGNDSDSGTIDDILDWQSLLEDSKELSHAALNAKRKQMTFLSFADEAIPDKIRILDSIIMPNVEVMNTLFLRSKNLGLLFHTPREQQEERAELMERLGHKTISST